MVEAAQIQAGQRVLDVACGTGVVTRAAAERVGASGSVVGLDVSEGMLAIAAQRAPSIEWRQGNTEALPFEDASFDAVTCQLGLMFFEDRRAALGEMWRVLRPGGHLAVAVWNSLDQMPGFAIMIDLVRRLFPAEAPSDLAAPFSLGDARELQKLFVGSGIPNATLATYSESARFPSVRSWMENMVRNWLLAGALDDAQFANLCAEAEQAFAPFVTADSSVVFKTSAHIVMAVKA